MWYKLEETKKIIKVIFLGHVEILEALNRWKSRVRPFNFPIKTVKNIFDSINVWKHRGRYRVDVME